MGPKSQMTNVLTRIREEVQRQNAQREGRVRAYAHAEECAMRRHRCTQGKAAT